eukprot:TRINITY_DN5186_c0_g1_i7.p2 TRINITY_DN5186_c0_g1~~TRINITY_DN5186_c0_g1_i7.p2  ORF type:complete len:156 (-),score=28.14 TRINITY_DN5186_c0_g1_i7:141-608(-)
MLKVNAKYKRGLYGYCPRAKCELQVTLPTGISDAPGQRSIKLFCPKCKEVYASPKQFKKVDSAFFGTNFPQLFFMVYPSTGQTEKVEFEGTIKGFRIHKSSFTHPPKVQYSPSHNNYEIIPRPVVEFNEDEESIAKFMAARRSFLTSKLQSTNKH